jgi:predicted ATPase
MRDLRQTIFQKYRPQNRYNNFGACLHSVKINGFRGIHDLEINFEYPITAISGINGSGKSTIGQLAICGYKKPVVAQNYKRYYIKDFFPVNVADPTPFGIGSNVVYSYTTNLPRNQELTVTRMQSEWSGYKRQPERHCFYVGFTLYIPKVERKDLSIYRAQQIELGLRRELSDISKQHVGRILNNHYDDIAFQEITHLNKSGELGLASRNGHVYSENNMGFGEGRLLYMIDMMENTPTQSLFVIEEPETSLHEDAQHHLANYFLDVVNRRHHQIILSTHSNIILETLPPEARKFLIRQGNQVRVHDKLSAYRAKSLLSNGHEKALNICVEDDFASHLLAEIIRRLRPEILKVINIQPVGDTDAVRNAVNLLRGFNLRTIGIRDADKGSNPPEKLFSLPGAHPPEVEVYRDNSVIQSLNQEFNFDVEHIFNITAEIDHHEFGEILSRHAVIDQQILDYKAINYYIDNKGNDYFNDLIATIESEL